MHRRKFLSCLGTAIGGFTILPPATTYQRICKVARDTTIEPANVAEPIILITPFRYWNNLTPTPPTILPGQFADELMQTLFPMTHARST